jgi:hypothetical protein
MENTSNVFRLKLLPALSYLSIATLSVICLQPIFAAEAEISSQSLPVLPETATSQSEPLLIARNPKKALKRRKGKKAKQASRSAKQQAPISQTIEPNNSLAPTPAAPEDRSTETTPAVSGNNTPLNQAPIPTTVRSTRPSPRDNYGVNLESNYSSWSDNFGNRGSQLVVPLTVTYTKDNLLILILMACCY